MTTEAIILAGGLGTRLREAVPDLPKSMAPVAGRPFLSYVIDYLRFQMKHTGLLRIDHVMGLHRLWWVPHGYPASAGAYIRYPAEELYGILSVESHRHKTTLVGENLGTVPPEVNKSMDMHGVRRMYVLQYEQQPKGSLAVPERAVVASVNTHDMPSFAPHWSAADIDDRADLGLIPKNGIEIR